jgi:hypothetical protein
MSDLSSKTAGKLDTSEGHSLPGQSHTLVVEVTIEPGKIEATYIENGCPIHGAGDSTGTLATFEVVNGCLDRLREAAIQKRNQLR